MNNHSGSLPMFQVSADGKPEWSEGWNAVFAERLRGLADCWVVFEIESGDKYGNRSLYAKVEFELKLTSAGKLPFSFRALFYKLIAFNAGQMVELSIHKRRNQRSLPQNGYYWSTVVRIMTGFLIEQGWQGKNGYPLSKEDTHKWLAYEFNSVVLENHETGEAKKVTFSTADKDFTTTNFNDYLDRIILFANDNGVDIPPPDPKWKENQTL